MHIVFFSNSVPVWQLNSVRLPRTGYCMKLIIHCTMKQRRDEGWCNWPRICLSSGVAPSSFGIAPSKFLALKSSLQGQIILQSPNYLEIWPKLCLLLASSYYWRPVGYSQAKSNPPGDQNWIWVDALSCRLRAGGQWSAPRVAWGGQQAPKILAAQPCQTGQNTEQRLNICLSDYTSRTQTGKNNCLGIPFLTSDHHNKFKIVATASRKSVGRMCPWCPEYRWSAWNQIG
jgi:hypothetical protein